jgi:hypothetical protein
MKKRLSRREFVARSSAGLAAFALGPILTSCDSPTGSRGESRVTLFSNPTDPQLASVRTDDGTQVHYFGRRSAAGVPSFVDRLLVERREGQGVWMDLDAQSRPTRLQAEDGTTLELAWLGPRRAVLTLVSSDGAAQSTVEFDFANPGAAAARMAPSAAPSGTRTRAGRAVLREVQAPIAAEGPAYAVAGAGCTVNVRQCGALRASPVTVGVRVWEPGIDGDLLGNFPAYRQGEGVYRAVIPTDLNPPVRLDEVCEQIGDVMGAACDAWDFISQTPGAAEAMVVTMESSLVLVLSPEPLSKLVLIVEWMVIALEVVCGVQGTEVADGVCDAEVLNRSFGGNVALVPYVLGMPGDFIGQPVTVPGTGPFPTLTVELPALPEVRRLTVSPAAPSAGTDYVATADVACLPRARGCGCRSWGRTATPTASR